MGLPLLFFTALAWIATPDCATGKPYAQLSSPSGKESAREPIAYQAWEPIAYQAWEPIAYQARQANVSGFLDAAGSDFRDSAMPGTRQAAGSDTSDSDRDYLNFVEDWHRNRIEILKSERGWLRLAGLYWLQEGEQSFGSSPAARVRFPEGSIPGLAGIFEVREDTVIMRVARNIDIRDERRRFIRDEAIFTPEVTRELTYRTLTWFVVQREDMVGIRLYDDNSPHLRHFNGIDRFDVDKKWRVQADFTPVDEGTTMLIENVLGQMVEWDVAGTLGFAVDGHEARILALGTGNRLFIPFADGTSGRETYPAGRFVYIDRPAPGEQAVIDFNVSYNPPCAINPHTTCPLPPPQNRLPFPIRAGEKHYEMYQD